MDDLLYESCSRYFTNLSNYGYRRNEDVKKLLFYVFVNELVNTTSVVITEDDYRSLEKALYCLYGTTCLIPYPNYCYKVMDGHLGNIPELVARVVKLEDITEDITEDVDDLQTLTQQHSELIDEIANTEVVKTYSY